MRVERSTMWVRYAKRAALVTGAAAPFAYVSFRYRPLNTTEDTRARPLRPSSALEQWLYDSASAFAITITSSLFTSLLRSFNTVDLVDLEKLHEHVRGPRPASAPLVTVFNHCSMLDDPGLMSMLAPREFLTWPARGMRWGVCTENICFTNPVHAVWTGLGRGLPIRRGGSIYQKGVATLQEKVNAGEWVHVFAEGRVWQDGGLPRRDAEGRWCSASGRCGPPMQRIAPLKWGVGKVIANAEVLPIIVPAFHWGMGDIVIQDSGNNFVGLDFFSGALITAVVGDPVQVADLVEAYHEKARARAEVRNVARKRMVEALENATAWSGWWASWWPWKATGGVPPARRHLTSRPFLRSPTPALNPALRPINTDEDASDHSGSSAHIAGLARVVRATRAAEPVRVAAEALENRLVELEFRREVAGGGGVAASTAVDSSPLTSVGTQRATPGAFHNSVSTERPVPVLVPSADVPEIFSHVRPRSPHFSV